MKILILVHNLTNGGAERVAALWATGFSKNNDVIIVTNDDVSPITYTVPNTVKIISIASHKNNRLHRFVDSINNLRQIIFREHPQLIIGVLSSRLKWAALFSKIKHIPVINTEHNAFERPDSAPLSRKEYFNKFYLNQIYDGTTVLTHADQSIIRNRLKMVRVLPNPCSYPPANDYIIQKKTRIILASGRLNVWHCKGFDILLKAWGQASKEVESDWKLIIAGKGDRESENYLKNLAINLGINARVEFIGYVSDILQWYKKASIFVLSSRYEGFGMVLLEAMSQGCACIACDYKGRQKEILGDQETGLIVKPDNINDLSRAIIKVCNDDKYRLKIQKSGIERSKYFSLENTMDRWNDIISDFTQQ